MKPISIVVIDDSAFMRKFLRGLLESDGAFDVHVASNGKEGLEIIAKVKPRVVTLDINMPVMDGLTCLAHIMTQSPTAVVMVSSLTREGELATLEALAMGAVDYIEKPGGTVSLNMDVIADELLRKIKNAAGCKLRKSVVPATPRATPAKKAPQSSSFKAAIRPIATPESSPSATSSSKGRGRFDLVVIGCSTGGPGALEQLLPLLPDDFGVPIIIAQHMPARFTASFAERMDSRSQLSVREVARSLQLEPGIIGIGRGDADLVVSGRTGGILAMSVPHDPKCYWAPSVGRLVESAMRAVDPKKVLAVMLTGMGDDGAQAMTELKNSGGYVIAESEETAVIFGMPGRLVEMGGANEIVRIEKIAGRLQSLVRSPTPTTVV